MKNTLVMVSLTLAIGLLSASSASAASNEEVKKCLKTPGATFVDHCYCPRDFQFNDAKGECEAAKCEEVKGATPAAAPKPTKVRRAAAEESPPDCTVKEGGSIVADSPGKPLSVTVNCEKANRPLSMITGTGDTVLEVGDKKGKSFSDSSERPQKGKGPYSATFLVRPKDPEKGGTGTFSVKSKGKDLESQPTYVSVSWPSKALPPPPPPPPPPPAPPVDPMKVACEERDSGKYDPKRVPPCECPAGSEPKVWTDEKGNLHLCKLKPVVGPPGESKLIKEIITKGDQGHFLLELGGQGMAMNGKFATGLALTIGYSLGFAQPVSKWHLTVDASLLLMPISRYSNGVVMRDSSGDAKRDIVGFGASAIVSYTFHPMFRAGLGPEYIELGYHTAGRTAEFIGGRIGLVLLPYRGENATVEIFLSPQIGWMVGGPMKGGAVTSGARLGAGVFF